MFGDTVVPIDGSRNSRRAIRIAAAIAATLGGRLDVVCFTRSPITRDFRRQVHRLVKEEGATVPMHVEVDPQHGPAERLITAYVRAHPAHLVCMAAHGRSRSPALLGTVTESVIRSSQRPVLLVGPSTRTVDYDPRGPILLASGDPEPAAVAQGWADVFGGEVFLTTPGRASAMAAEVPTAAADHASVIVASLGEQGRISRLVHGSELAEVIHDAPCPVIAVAPAGSKTAAGPADVLDPSSSP